MSDDCPICLEPIDDIDVCRTRCNHRFHTSCLCKAFVTLPKCPVCRSEIVTSISGVDIEDNEVSIWLVEVVHNLMTEERRNYRPWRRMHSRLTYPTALRAQVLQRRMMTSDDPTDTNDDTNDDS